ncbi:hypothetical protein K456DRAFT_30887 [Colletotrichum gloeosporioides 23]|nr:hypothetical protein K456DRAFT_30887 [Colletotrichum gloeosporioides 23]
MRQIAEFCFFVRFDAGVSQEPVRRLASTGEQWRRCLTVVQAAVTCIMIANVMSPFDMVLVRANEAKRRRRREIDAGCTEATSLAEGEQGVRLGEGTTSWCWTNRVPLAKRNLLKHETREALTFSNWQKRTNCEMPQVSSREMRDHCAARAASTSPVPVEGLGRLEQGRP